MGVFNQLKKVETVGQRFKMYKSGKLWVIAGLALLTMLIPQVAGQNSVLADTVQNVTNTSAEQSGSNQPVVLDRRQSDTSKAEVSGNSLIENKDSVGSSSAMASQLASAPSAANNSQSGIADDVTSAISTGADLNMIKDGRQSLVSQGSSLTSFPTSNSAIMTSYGSDTDLQNENLADRTFADFSDVTNGSFGVAANSVAGFETERTFSDGIMTDANGYTVSDTSNDTLYETALFLPQKMDKSLNSGNHMVSNTGAVYDVYDAYQNAVFDDDGNLYVTTTDGIGKETGYIMKIDADVVKILTMPGNQQLLRESQYYNALTDYAYADIKQRWALLLQTKVIK